MKREITYELLRYACERVLVWVFSPSTARPAPPWRDSLGVYARSPRVPYMRGTVAAPINYMLSENTQTSPLDTCNATVEYCFFKNRVKKMALPKESASGAPRHKGRGSLPEATPCLIAKAKYAAFCSRNILHENLCGGDYG